MLGSHRRSSEIDFLEIDNEDCESGLSRDDSSSTAQRTLSKNIQRKSPRSTYVRRRLSVVLAEASVGRPSQHMTPL